MRVLPVEGRTVRDPVSRAVLEEKGLEVSEHDSYWLRRLTDGDVRVEGENPLEAGQTKEVQPEETTPKGEE